MNHRAKRFAAFFLAASLFGISASAASAEINEKDKLPGFPLEEGEIRERPLSADELEALRSNESNEIIEIPIQSSAMPRASYTYGIVGWEANSEHILEDEVELKAAESVTVSGNWNNPSARMAVRLYIRQNNKWTPTAVSTFSSGYSTSVRATSAGVYKVVAIPPDYIGGGSITLTFS